MNMVIGLDLSTYIVRNKIVTKKANSNPGTLQPGSSWQENITVTIQQQPHSFSNQVDIRALNNILQSFSHSISRNTMYLTWTQSREEGLEQQEVEEEEEVEMETRSKRLGGVPSSAPTLSSERSCRLARSE